MERLTAHYLLRTTWRVLLTAYCFLLTTDLFDGERLTAYRFPLTAYRLPLTAYHLPLTAYHFPLTACRLPLTAYRFPLPAYHLPLPAYHLPLSAYRLPLTAYRCADDISAAAGCSTDTSFPALVGGHV